MRFILKIAVLLVTGGAGLGVFSVHAQAQATPDAISTNCHEDFAFPLSDDHQPDFYTLKKFEYGIFDTHGEIEIFLAPAPSFTSESTDTTHRVNVSDKSASVWSTGGGMPFRSYLEGMALLTTLDLGLGNDSAKKMEKVLSISILKLIRY